MFANTKPNRTGMAQSASSGTAQYLIDCKGTHADGRPCGEMIWVSPRDKSVCPHCGRVYETGYMGVVNPIRNKG